MRDATASWRSFMAADKSSAVCERDMNSSMLVSVDAMRSTSLEQLAFAARHSHSGERPLIVSRNNIVRTRSSTRAPARSSNRRARGPSSDFSAATNSSWGEGSVIRQMHFRSRSVTAISPFGVIAMPSSDFSTAASPRTFAVFASVATARVAGSNR